MTTTDNPITQVANFFKNIDYDKIIKNAGLGLEFIKKQAVNGSIETTKMLLELYYVMMDENTSKFNKFIIGSALAYQFLPNDFISRDDYGFLGYVDNAGILYLAYQRMKKSITPEIAQKVEDTLKSWGKSIDEFTIMKPKEEQV